VLLAVAWTRDEACEVCAALDEREDRNKPFTLEEIRRVKRKLMVQDVPTAAPLVPSGRRWGQSNSVNRCEAKEARRN
jgi:hypothetical protein